MDLQKELIDIRKKSVKYWETRRIVYNTILALFSFILITLNTMEEDPFTNRNFNIALIGHVIGANVCFTFAYVPEFYFQLSKLKETWCKYRIIILAFGTFISLILARISIFYLLHIHIK